MSSCQYGSYDMGHIIWPMAMNNFSGQDNDKEYKFFISTDFNYEKQKWKSGFFQINDADWQSTDTNEYRFPILGSGR